MMSVFNILAEDLEDFISYKTDNKLVVLKKTYINDLYYYELSDENTYILQKELEPNQSKLELFGKDKTEHIKCIETLENNQLLFIKKDNTTFTKTYKPWSLSKTKHSNSKQLLGNQSFKYFNEFETKDQQFEFNKRIGFREVYSSMNDLTGQMILHGYNMYKNVSLEDLSVLSFDIETSGLVRNKTSYVYCIGNVFKKAGKLVKKVFREDEYQDDKEMIKDWVKWVQEIDPDVITGHNIINFDLDYLYHCNNGLDIGKYAKELVKGRKRNYRVSGDEKWEYEEIKIFGRQVIDTMFTSVKFDIGRKYPTWGLKPILKYEETQAKQKKIAERDDWEKRLIKHRETRTFIDFDDLLPKEIWQDIDNRDSFINYCMDDAMESLFLFEKQIVPWFYYCQYVPMSLQEVCLTASGAQIDAFLVRSYLQNGYSIPVASEHKSFLGGISMGIPGIYKNVVKFDVASLYPSVILTQKLYSKNKDPEQHFLKMVEYFTKMRLEYKRKAKETKNPIFEGLQQAFKIIINSSYGVCGTKYLQFNDFNIASKITEGGREILQKGVTWASGQEFGRVQKLLKNGQPELDDEDNPKYEWILKDGNNVGKGFNISNVDTDSFSFTTGKTLNKEDIELLRTDLNSLFNGIIWDDDGYYERFIVLKAKNYILQKKVRESYSVKGSGLTDSKREKKLTEFNNKIIEALLKENLDNLFDIYRNYIDDIKNLTDVSGWLKKYKITEAVLDPKRKQEIDIYNAVSRKHNNLQLGERYYMFRGKDDTLLFEDEFNGQNHCIDTLLEKTYNSLKIFGNVIDIRLFPNYTLTANRSYL